MLVFDSDGLFDLTGGKSGVMHSLRVQRDVLAHLAARAVFVGKTEVVALMSKCLAPAIALDFLQYLRNIQRDLVGLARLAGEHQRRQGGRLRR